MQVDAAAVIAEVRAAFDEYEAALVANDVDALDTWFWADQRVVRFAFGEVQLGAAAVSAARRALPRQTPPRTAQAVHVHAYGPDVAVVFAVFRLDDSAELVHQSQLWARVDGGWHVAAAHVSS